MTLAGFTSSLTLDRIEASIAVDIKALHALFAHFLPPGRALLHVVSTRPIDAETAQGSSP